MISTWSGVRPVIDTGKADPSKESREHAIWKEDGLLTITGGKLTTFAVMARDALSAAEEDLGGLRARTRVLEPNADGVEWPSMDLAKSSFPRPTKELKWPHDSFQFEDLTVELHGFEWAAHCDDHSAWLLKQERIVHSPDLINPDQPPFWRFAGNERFRFHEENLKQVYGLAWDYLSGSHGNIGSRADMDFQFAFIADMKAAVGKAMGEHPFTEFVNPKAKAHTEFLSKFFGVIATEATKTLRPKYGDMYGFEEATPANAEMVAWAMFEYR